MTVTYHVVSIAHLGKRTVARCQLCRLDLGHFTAADDARAEGVLHTNRYHRTDGDAA